VGICIELPGGEIERTTGEMAHVTDSGSSTAAGQADATDAREIIEAPVISTREEEVNTELRKLPSETNKDDNRPMEERTVIGARKQTPTESQRILEEIDRSKLLQEELIRREPSLASVSSFLSTVCGGGTRDKTVKKKDEARSKEADTEIEIIPLSVQTRSEAPIWKDSV